jgi:HEAT repeat protein
MRREPAKVVSYPVRPEAALPRRAALLAVSILFLLACPSPSHPGDREAAAETDPGIRAIDEAFASGGTSAAPRILPYLRDPQLPVRNHAMRRLVDIGEPAVDLLIPAMADRETRWLASGALINIGTPAVRKTVLAVRDPDPAVRRGALFVLQQLEVGSAAPSIQGALEDPDPSVQVQAIRAVAHFRGEGALRLLLARVDSPDPVVRDAAVEAMARLGSESLPPLRELLGREEAGTRAAAVRALGAVGTPEAIGLVRSSLTDRAFFVRHDACRALGEAADTASVPALVRLLSDPEPSVREAAGEACARMPEAAESALFALFREGTVLQKIEVANVFRKAMYRRAVPLLVDAIRDPSHEVCLSAAAALMVISDPASVEAFVNGLRDPKIRWVCVIGLRQLGSASVPFLLRRTGDAELDYWKQHALEGMGEQALEGCVEVLQRGGDAGTRSVALCTLQQIRDARAAYPVVHMMGDPQVGTVAAFLAGRMGEVAVEPLLVSLRDESPVVRARAAQVLADLREMRAVAPLRAMLSDADPSVREAAGKALERLASPAPPSEAAPEPRPRPSS